MRAETPVIAQCLRLMTQLALRWRRYRHVLCKCWSRMPCTLFRAMSGVRLGQYVLWVLLAEGHRCYSTQIVRTQKHDTMPVHALLVKAGKAGQRKSQDPN